MNDATLSALVSAALENPRDDATLSALTDVIKDAPPDVVRSLLAGLLLDRLQLADVRDRMGRDLTHPQQCRSLVMSARLPSRQEQAASDHEALASRRLRVSLLHELAQKLTLDRWYAIRLTQDSDDTAGPYGDLHLRAHLDVTPLDGADPIA